MREIYDFLEGHPDVPLPYIGVMNAFAESQQLSEIARAMAPCNKSTDGGFFSLARKFGSVTLSLNFERDQVCERVIIGTEEIPKKVTEAYTKDIVEWHCPESILGQ